MTGEAEKEAFTSGSRGGEEQIERLPPQKAEELEALGAVVEVIDKPELGRMKIDLHCHSEASHDCSTPVELFPARCKYRQISVQAITDHNQIWGAQKLKQLVEEKAQEDGWRMTVIVGEEISTREGEIIGLFLKEKIEAGLRPEETVERIKAQDGLVLLPHGFDPLKRWRLKPEAVERIAGAIDIVETFNARISRLHWNRAAVTWTKERGALLSAGSDAHTLGDIGSAWVEVDLQPINEPQVLLEALKGGTPEGEWTHPAIAYAYKVFDRMRRSLRVS